MHDGKLKVFFYFQYPNEDTYTSLYAFPGIGSDSKISREKKIFEPAAKIRTVNVFRASAFCTLLPP